MRAATLAGSLLAATLAVTATAPSTPYNDLQWIQSEIDFIAKLQARLTGSPEHNILIDHIESELKRIGLHVYEDIIEFSYSDPPVIQPVLKVNGQNIQLSGWIPYSGTNSSSATGKLVNVVTPNITATPNWAAAKDAIALANLTNVALDYNTLFGAWSLSAPWPPQPGVPAISGVEFTNLVAAAAAGVRGVVYIWDNITAGLADDQYVPFQQANLAIPGVYVQSASAILHLLDAARSGTDASIDLPGKRVPNTRSRTLYAIVNGTDHTLRNETVIINTHTDGVNAVEENGHIALLNYARRLKANPPRRTTILLFVTGHMHYGELVAAPARATDLWLRAHPELWNGTQRAVFGSCVEHMGAVQFAEDFAKGTYEPTGGVEPEWLFAATAPLAALVQRLWSGAEPNVTRVLNPNTGEIAQSGEGLPLLKAGIPEVSLVTSPAWLLKFYDRGFDERTLVDTKALVRQVASFERLWNAVDGLSAEDLQ
ncbi:hypothetical protein MSAN_00087500 [Mycena sanguinolenta]|uniref:Peptidase M28 domain-containing protein n=1 Tax=Mycena sanguinolenta TaxID=230812 RepID=A0A8H7DJN7_9AGAR|nr:hypothetical protein MSAN_00087500 [Mycena sanguinolenta]